MEFSRRRFFGRENQCSRIEVASGVWDWGGYFDWRELGQFEQISQVRTYDSLLNPIIDDDVLVSTDLRTVEGRLTSFPLENPCQYLQLAFNLAEELIPDLPEWVHLLGYDLIESDFRISSLLNCGPWRGELAPFTARLNEYGLLSLEDARQADQMLPEVWGEDEPHAYTDIWAICEVILPSGSVNIGAF